jgi:hypothetical protein
LKALARAAREGRSLADVSEEDGTRVLTAAEEAAEEERAYAKELSKEVRGIPYSKSLQDGESESESDDDDDDDVDVDEDASEEDSDGDSDGDDSDDDSDEDEDSDADAEKKKKKEKEKKDPKKPKKSRLTLEMAMREKDVIVRDRLKNMGEDAEAEAMRYVMLPRKKRELYKAAQLGLAKKEARAAELEETKRRLKAEGTYGKDYAPEAADDGGAKAKKGSKKAKTKK